MSKQNTEKQNSERGFTLLELLVSMAVGLIVMAAMAGLFKAGMDSAMVVTQRAETQQNMRAAIDLMVKDISMAGAGLPSGGIQLPTGAGSSASLFACDQSGTCHVPGNTYPNSNYMYGIIPGFSNGVEGNAVVPAAPPPAINDSITSIYADYNFPLWEYDVTFPVPGNGTAITLTPDAAYVPAPPLIAAAGGIQVGDLIMLSNSLGTAVGEVTGIAPNEIEFADLDPLNINQNGAATNNIAAISNGANTVAYRLFAVTYYLTVPPPNGETPRLMRQVNGLSPVPVADNIINLQFSYDIYNSTTSALDANQPNPLGRRRFAQPDAEDQPRGHGAKHGQPREQIAELVSGDFRQRPQYGISQSLSVTPFEAGGQPVYQEKVGQVKQMGQKKNRSHGFTLIAALLILVLLSGVAAGLLFIVTNESRMGGNDLESNMAYYGAESGMEKLTADLSSLYTQYMIPTNAQIQNLANFPPTPAMVSGMNYTETITYPTDASGNPVSGWNTVSAGANQGLVRRNHSHEHAGDCHPSRGRQREHDAQGGSRADSGVSVRRLLRL